MDTIKNVAAKITGASSNELALPKGSLILVTGASSYVGSHVIHEALQAGYKVRGTARTEEKVANTKKIFNNHPDYSTAIAADFQHEGAFDEAVQGVDAVIHVASDLTFEADPNKVVKTTVAGVYSILHSAARTPSVKRFVLTSSSTAVLLPHPNVEVTKTVHDWNQEALDLAWAPPPYTKERGIAVYAASKTEGEQALWKFVKEEKPHFVANAILPNLNMGRILPYGSMGATGDRVLQVMGGKIPTTVPQYHIDVIDDARLHVIAAVLDPTIENERIFAFNVPFNWTDVINILQKIRPQAKLPTPPENEARDLSKVPNERGAELLRKWYAQDGYKSLAQSVEENLEGQE